MRQLSCMGKILFKMSCTYQTLFRVTAYVELMPAYRFVFTGVFYFLMVVK